MDEKEKVIKDAQYRKGLSIAFFNATNNAIEMVKLKYQGQDISKVPMDQIMEAVTTGRNWLLEEHKNYYATVIAQVGVNYKVADTIEKLKKTTSLDELSMVWRSLSADERHDKEVRKIASELKQNYETAH